MDLSILAQFLQAVCIEQPSAQGDRADQIPLRGVSHHAQWVRPGDIFVAIRGLKQDGHVYIPQALQRGAVAVVGEGFAQADVLPVPYFQVPNARKSLADLAALLYDYPSTKLRVIGVTGTKGKTTTAWLLRHLLREAGHKVGLLSTLGYLLDDETLHQFPEHLTTPEAPQIQAILAQMVEKQCTYAIIEASSEALALQRLHGMQIDVGIWTNLSPEHMNFHGTMEDYFQAKRMLIDQSSFAILNREDSWGMRLAQARPHQTYAHTGSSAADWQGEILSEDEHSITFRVRYRDDSFVVSLPMLGAFNIPNALAALATAHYFGVPLPTLANSFSTFQGIPGRMQVLTETPVRVVLDFAHTPDSLQKALSALRQTTQKRLIVVIGAAGGNRDAGKRIPLGRVAAEYADTVFFTEEDNRETPLEEILADMQQGAIQSGKENYHIVPDRAQAIRAALQYAMSGDTVALCGKAGETTLERTEGSIPWNEMEIAKNILAHL